MAEPFLGEIYTLPYNFAPKGFAFCAGQLLPIQQNTALFSLLGTFYGGNGIQTFALPDLRGRVALGVGQGPGLSAYNQGQTGGEENHTLLYNEMPAHSHAVNAVTSGASATNVPTSNFLANAATSQTPSQPSLVYSTDSPSATLAPAAIASAGGSQPHNNVMPYLAVSYCIALQGIFPSRN